MTSTPSKYTASNVGDLANVLPTMFGFAPNHSIAAVATYGPRLGFRLRVDLPPYQHIAELAGMINHHLTTQGAEGFVIFGIGDSTEKQRAEDVMRAVIDASALPVMAAVWVNTETRLATMLGDDEQTFPFDWTTNEAMALAVSMGQSISSSREEIVASYATASGTPLFAEVESHLEDLVNLDADAVIMALARIMEGVQVAPSVALLVQAVAHEELRDALLGVVNREMAQEQACALLTAATNAPADRAAPLYALCAFANWQHGDGARALIGVERALELDPSNTLAPLLLQVLENGIHPNTWNPDNEVSA